MAAGPATARRPEGPRADGDLSASGTLIPPNIREGDRATFIATQRERLSTLLSALDREAAQIGRPPAPAEGGSTKFGNPWAAPAAVDGPEERERPASGLSKSRSEADFEKIDAESGAEELDEDGVRRRGGTTPSVSSGGWMPWPFAGGAEGKSSGVEK